jgi:hypothetical protein
MAQLRAVFTALHRLVSTLLCIIALQFFTFILTTIMKRLGVAQCSVANELLRRREQMDCDDAPLELGIVRALLLEGHKGRRKPDADLLGPGPTMTRASADGIAIRTVAHNNGNALPGEKSSCRPEARLRL